MNKTFTPTTKAPTTGRAIHCPICGELLTPPTPHSCFVIDMAVLEDLSAIADYLRQAGDGHIAPAGVGMVA